MPRYSINIWTDSQIAASAPVEKDDLTALQVEMARFVGEQLKDHAALIWQNQDWQIEVTDESGLIIYVLRVSASVMPVEMDATKSR